MQLQNVTIFCFLASYVCALILELTQFLRQNKVLSWAALAMGAAGFVAQSIYLVERSRQTDLPPLLGSTHDWLLVSAWLAIVFYLGVKIWDRTLAVGVFILPLVLLLVISSRFVRMTANPRIEIAPGWSMLHASFWVFGIVGVLLSLVVSIMYLLQHYRLKHKKAEIPALHLLSLERLNRINWWMIVISVPLLTLGMVTGLWMSYLATEADVPVNLANVAFISFALIWVAMTMLFGWLLVAKHATGRVVAWRTALACGFLLVTLLAIKFLSADGIHMSGSLPARLDLSINRTAGTHDNVASPDPRNRTS